MKAGHKLGPGPISTGTRDLESAGRRRLSASATARGLVLLVVATATLSGGAPGTLGAEIRGRVTEAGTQKSVAWATVSLDARPPDGSAEYTTQTDVFGMFVLDGVTPDDYRIKVEHAGHEPSVGDIALDTADARRTMSFSLVGTDQETRITLHFGVSCVQTYAGIPDASITVVRWDRYAARAAPDEIQYVHTDKAGDHIGQAVLPGIKTGDFRFSVSRNGWEILTIPPTGQDPVHLDTDYTVSAALKPVYQDLHVQVTGYDPKQDQADQSLSGIMVELTGLDFSESEELVAPRTVLTDANGQAVFRNLPQIPWRVRAFSPGYTDAEQIARAGDAGYPPVNLALSMGQTTIEVELRAPLYEMQLAEYGQVRLTGIDGSATAGIDRTLSAVEGARGRIRARVTNLVPGRYMVRVAHSRFVLPPTYPGLGYSTPEPSHGYGYQAEIRFEPVRLFTEVELDETRIVSVDLKPVPAVITGVLLAGEKPSVDSMDLWSGDVFTEKMQSGIEFVQPDAEAILKPEFAVESVDTDAAGRFTIELPPGVFGIRIPGLHDYTGFDMTLINPDTGEPIIDEWTQSAKRGWPYAETDNYPYPVVMYPRQIAGPMLLQSGDRYEMVLRIHKKQAIVVVPVRGVRSPLYHALISVDPVSSTYSTFEMVDLQGTTTLTRLDDGLQFVHRYAREEGFEEPGTLSGFAAIFSDVPPGVYDIDVQLDHFSPRQSTVTVPVWGDPGFLPSDPFFQTTWVTPGDPLQPENSPNINWINLPTLSPGPIQVTDYIWDEYNGAYYQGAVAKFGALVKRGHDDADGNPIYAIGVNGGNMNNSISGAPDGLYTFWWPGSDRKWYRVAAADGRTTFEFYHGGPQDDSALGLAPPPFQGGAGLSYEARISTVSTGDPNYLIGGITVPLPDGSTPAQFVSSDSGPTAVQLRSPPGTDTFSGIQTTQWLHWGYDDWTLVSANPIVFNVLVPFKRGMQVSGRVVADPATRAALAGARVTVYSRGGTQLLDGLSDAQGQFALGPIDTQSVYIEIRATGHLPFRKRYSPGPQDNPDIATGDIALTPIPAPAIQSLTLNRFGLFLPGVLKSGDASGYNMDNADSALTATWQAVIQPVTLSFTLEGFDDEQGAPQQKTFEVVDPVRDIWLVDKRWFEALPAEDPAASANSLGAPSPLTASAVRALMTDIRATEKDGRPFYVVYNPGLPSTARGPVGRERAPSPATYQGALKLYNLPAGRFLPMLLVVTERGAAAAKDYLVPDGKKALQGLLLPKWSATFLEVIGIASTFAPDVDPSQATPQGRFVPLPDFDSGI
ncbi:MAG: carboxypeptidase regulatory-like domain-containing protein, partial [Kiritimatiellaeota bacterium]|nr:carboxypeptidase regulatory-like domain-containing protein [Kiritimatiellota bacterium]